MPARTGFTTALRYSRLDPGVQGPRPREPAEPRDVPSFTRDLCPGLLPRFQGLRGGWTIICAICILCLRPGLPGGMLKRGGVFPGAIRN